MKQILTALAVAFIAGLATPVNAKETYICEMKSHTSYGGIPGKIAFIFEDGRSAAQVFDGMIKKVYGDPIDALLKTRREGVYGLSWVVEDVQFSNTNYSSDFQYQAVLNLKSLKATMQGIYSGMDIDPYRGSGKCKPVE